MGSTVHAKCDCGYEKNNLPIGGGMLNFQSFCSFPVYCKRCQNLATPNLLIKSFRCPECRSTKVLAYDNHQLRKQKGKNIVTSWNVIDRLGRELKLTDGKYFCPCCQEFNLRFSEGDILWD